MELAKQWGLGLVVFILMDAVWLGVLANGFYKRELGPLLRQHANGNLDPRILPAVLLYALIVLGLALFALPRARTGGVGEAALWSRGLRRDRLQRLRPDELLHHAGLSPEGRGRRHDLGRRRLRGGRRGHARVRRAPS